MVKVLQSLPYYRVLLLITVCYGVLSACSKAVIPEEEATPGRGVTDVTQQITTGGQQYSLAFMPDAQEITLHFIWPNSWALNNNLATITRLGVDLMSGGGAGSRSAAQVRTDITELGSAASLSATPDHIYGTFTSALDTLPGTLEIISDVITTPELDAKQFELLKAASIARSEQRQGQASAKLWSTARRVLLGKSPLVNYWNNQPVEQLVMPRTLAEVKQWHRETFVRNTMTVVVAGNIDTATASQFIDTTLSGLPDNGSTTAEASGQSINTASGATVLLHDPEALQTLIAVVGELPPTRDGNELSDVVAVAALGTGKTSRLAGVTAEGAAPVTSNIANFSRDVRVFGINAASENDTAAELLTDIEQAYVNFTAADLTDEEVLKGVVTFANSLRESASRVDLVAYGLGQLLLDSLPTDLLVSVMQDTLALKAPEINQRITDKYPQWNQLLKVVISSDAELLDADCVISILDDLDACEL